MANIKLKTKGMHCPSCEILVKDSLEESEGVNKADVNHKSGEVKVNFNESKIKESKIKEIINKEGYEVE